jgi:hypothetical protein
VFSIEFVSLSIWKSANLFLLCFTLRIYEKFAYLKAFYRWTSFHLASQLGHIGADLPAAPNRLAVPFFHRIVFYHYAQGKHHFMTRFIFSLAGVWLFAFSAGAQKLKKADVPAAAQHALVRYYPTAAHVVWEKEKGNYEANWGGRSNEDSSVIFTPAGQLVEMAVAIQVRDLPSGVVAYVRKNYPGVRVTEAARVTDAAGKISYEAEAKGKDLIFDESGAFIKKE